MPFHRPIPEPKSPSDSSSALRGYVEAEKLLHIAFVLPSAVAIGWAAGWFLDNRLNQHWIGIVGVVLGSVSGLYYVIRQAIDAEKNSRTGAEDENGTDGEPPISKP